MVPLSPARPCCQKLMLFNQLFTHHAVPGSTLIIMKRLMVLVMACGTVSMAQDSQSRPTVIRATGEGVVSAQPDQARLRFAVVSTAGTAERARSRNADIATKVIAQLRDTLGQDADVRTANYSLNRYADGYAANSTIEVRVNDPTITGKLIDVAVKAGASVVGGIDSSVAGGQDARSEALKEATARARANAEAIASALGMRLVRVISAETSASPVSVQSNLAGPMASAKKTSIPTPVANGTIEIRAQVTLTIEAAP